MSDLTIQPGINAISKSAEPHSDRDGPGQRDEPPLRSGSQRHREHRGPQGSVSGGDLRLQGRQRRGRDHDEAGPRRRSRRFGLSQKFGFSAHLQEVGARIFPDSASAVATFGPDRGERSSRPASTYDHDRELAGRSSPSRTRRTERERRIGEHAVLAARGSNEHDGGIIQNTYYNKQALNIKLQQVAGTTAPADCGLNLLHTGDGRGLFQQRQRRSDRVRGAVGDAELLQPAAERQRDRIPPTRSCRATPCRRPYLFRNEEAINRGIGSLAATWHILSSGTNALNFVANGGVDYFKQQNNVYSPPTLQYEISVRQSGHERS